MKVREEILDEKLRELMWEGYNLGTQHEEFDKLSDEDKTQVITDTIEEYKARLRGEYNGISPVDLAHTLGHEYSWYKWSGNKIMEFADDLDPGTETDHDPYEYGLSILRERTKPIFGDELSPWVKKEYDREFEKGVKKGHSYPPKHKVG